MGDAIPGRTPQEARIIKPGLCRRGQSGHLKGLAHLERHERIRWIQEAEDPALGMRWSLRVVRGLIASDGLEERVIRFEVVRGLIASDGRRSRQAQDHSIVRKHKDSHQISIDIMNTHTVTSAVICPHSTHTHAYHAKVCSYTGVLYVRCGWIRQQAHSTHTHAHM